MTASETKTLYTSPKRFLNWYFKCNSDHSNLQLLKRIGEQVHEDLLERGVSVMNTRTIFKETEKCAYPVNLLYGFEMITDPIEIGEYFSKWELQLRYYPFEEGNDYWTIEDGKVVWSCWDCQSEELHTEETRYFRTEAEAKRQLGIENDLFTHPEDLPAGPKLIVDHYSAVLEAGNYDNADDILEAYLEAMESVGYTFEWGLDRTPYDLTKK